MNAVRQFLWKVLVVGMIPFILGAGLPQMECQCAAAKEQRYCECCFRKPGDASSTTSSLKPCCQRHQAAKDSSQSNCESRSECPTCHQFRNPTTGSCCSLTLIQAPTLTQSVEFPALDLSVAWLPMIVFDAQMPVIALTARHDVLSRACWIPPLDRVIVFEHLLI